MSEAVKEEKKEVKKAPASKTAYFKNTRQASLKVVWQRPEDRLAPNPEDRKVIRFTAYSDTWKGNPVRVGYLETDNPKAVKALEANSTCVKIDKAEYEKAMKELSKAPVKAS